MCIVLRSMWFQCDSIYFFDGIAEKGEREREEKKLVLARSKGGKNLNERKKRGTCYNSTKHEFLFPFSSSFFFGKVDYAQRANFFFLSFFSFTLVTISPLRCTNRETDKRGRALFTFYLRSSLSTPPRFREDLSRFTIKLFHASEITLVTSCLFVLGSIVPCFLLYLSNISAFFQEKGEREKEHTLSSDFISRV